MAASTWSTTDKSASMTLSGSNLIATASAGNVSVRGKDPKRVGKYYIEYTSTTTQNGSSAFGFAAARTPLNVVTFTSGIGASALSGAVTAYDYFGTSIAGLGVIGAITTSSLVCCAIDLDNLRCWFRLGAAGNWNGNAANNPATGVGGANLSSIGLGQGIDVYPFTFLGTSTNSITANFGGSAFTGAVPSGFTSGWDDSVSVLTNVVATQVALEEWAAGTPSVQLTQIAIEEWASVAAAAPGATQAYVMIMA